MSSNESVSSHVFPFRLKTKRTIFFEITEKDNFTRGKLEKTWQTNKPKCRDINLILPQTFLTKSQQHNFGEKTVRLEKLFV